ncbi:hypothetical protein BJX70DRAFT_345274 [Aspergillus crustosus]
MLGHTFPVIGQGKFDHLKVNVEALGLYTSREEINKFDTADCFGLSSLAHQFPRQRDSTIYLRPDCSPCLPNSASLSRGTRKPLESHRGHVASQTQYRVDTTYDCAIFI